MVTKTHVYDGSWREVKKIHIYDSSVATWRLIKYSYVWDGTAWRQVHTNAFVFNKTFTVNESDYDLVNDMISNGWNGTDDVEATVTVNPGVIVYSTVAGAPGYGLRISPNPPANPGKVIPAPSTITLTVNGQVVGKGGAGGAGGTTTFSTTPSPAPGYISGVTATATVGSAGSAGSPGLRLGFPITLNLPPAGRIKGGGGGGGGGGAVYGYYPATFPVYSKALLGARAPGGGGGGGAHGAPAPSGAGSPSSGGASEEPGAQVGNDGGTNAGAASSPNPTTFNNPSKTPVTVPLVGGGGGAGGAAGSAGSTGTTSTIGPNPGGASQTRAGGNGGATGRAVFGWGPVPAPTNINPASSVNLPSLIGPYS